MLIDSLPGSTNHHPRPVLVASCQSMALLVNMVSDPAASETAGHTPLRFTSALSEAARPMLAMSDSTPSVIADYELARTEPALSKVGEPIIASFDPGSPEAAGPTPTTSDSAIPYPELANSTNIFRCRLQVQQNSPLLLLPAELRNEIYQLSFSDGNGNDNNYWLVTMEKRRLPALMHTCHQLREESIHAYYSAPRTVFLDFEKLAKPVTIFHAARVPYYDLISRNADLRFRIKLCQGSGGVAHFDEASGPNSHPVNVNGVFTSLDFCALFGSRDSLVCGVTGCTSCIARLEDEVDHWIPAQNMVYTQYNCPGLDDHTAAARGLKEVLRRTAKGQTV